MRNNISDRFAETDATRACCACPGFGPGSPSTIDGGPVDCVTDGDARSVSFVLYKYIVYDIQCIYIIRLNVSLAS